MNCKKTHPQNPIKALPVCQFSINPYCKHCTSLKSWDAGMFGSKYNLSFIFTGLQGGFIEE